MFRISEDMYLWKKNVHSKDLKKELLGIFDTFSSQNMKQYSPQPYNHKVKHYYRFRIMENGMRVRDISFFNFILDVEGDTVMFKTKKGSKENWIKFNAPVDIVFNDNRSTIILNVIGDVYWWDGTRRYEDRYIETMDKFKVSRDNNDIKEYYNDCSFLRKRKITAKSMKHVENARLRIKNRKKNKKK